MDEDAATSVRRKKDASINVCMRLVHDGQADAVVTAGHTGAGVASAIVHLGRLPGVDRPALAIQMVTDRGPFMLLDIGATTDSTGLNLAQYGYMGALYAERVLGVSRPDRGAALHRRGGRQGRAAGQGRHRRCCRAASLRFIGNVEGRDLPLHPADVVVCDASVGNVVMKFFEGLAGAMFDMLRAEFKRPPWGPIGYLFMRPGINRIRRKFDYERLGAAPLLGVNGTVLITHGRAKRRMIGFAVEVGRAVGAGRHPGAHRGVARRIGHHPASRQRTGADALGDARAGPPTAATPAPCRAATAARERPGRRRPGRSTRRRRRPAPRRARGRRLCLEAVFEADFGQRTGRDVLERRIEETAADARRGRARPHPGRRRDRAPGHHRRRDRACRARLSGRPAGPDRPRTVAFGHG